MGRVQPPGLCLDRTRAHAISRWQAKRAERRGSAGCAPGPIPFVYLGIVTVFGAFALDLELGPFISLPAFLGIWVLALFTSMRGRKVELGTAPLALPACVPAGIAALLVELEVLCDEIATDPEDLDVLRRLEFWLEREAQLSADERQWLLARHTDTTAIRAALEQLLALGSTMASRRRQRSAARDLLLAMIAFGEVSERAERRGDPYRGAGC